MANVAKATGLAREALYRTCQPGKKPQFDTIVKIMRAVGYPLVPTMPASDTKKADTPKRKKKREAVTA